MGKPLDEVADAADAIARDQKQVARKVRRMQRRRDIGWSWHRVLEADENGDADEPSTAALLARSSDRLGDAVRAFRKVVATGLIDEGRTIRQIAKRFGVSHQRLSALLNHTNSRRADWG